MRVASRFVLMCTTLLAVLATRPAHAQGSRTFELSLTGGPLLFPAPTAADFAAGFAPHPTGVAFLVGITGNPPPPQTYQATVSVRGSFPTLGGYGKPIADLEWSLGSPAGPWMALTTVDANVESRTMQRDRINDPWGNTIHFRMRLAWDTDVPDTYSSGIVVTLTVTGP